MRGWRRLVLGLLGASCAASQPACRAGKPAPQAPGAGLPPVLQSLVGQSRILVGAGESQRLELKKGQPLPKGACDVAVTIRSVSFANAAAAAALSTLGWIEGERRGERACREVPPDRNLNLSGLAGAEDAAAALDGVLKTPEAYLGTRGVTFELPAAARPPQLAAALSNTSGSAEERQLRRELTAWPKLLLAVHALYNDPTDRVRYEGEVEFVAVVGPDGRLYQPSVRTALAAEHQEQLQRALALWRYEPARKGDERVAARVDQRVTLRVR